MAIRPARDRWLVSADELLDDPVLVLDELRRHLADLGRFLAGPDR